MRTRNRKPTHPDAIVRLDYMEPLGLTVTALAERLGVTRKHLSGLVNERLGVTPDMALRLSRAFGTTPGLWLNMQQTLDLYAAKSTPGGWEKVQELPGLAKLQS